jgi:hypothetical protein
VPPRGDPGAFKHKTGGELPVPAKTPQRKRKSVARKKKRQSKSQPVLIRTSERSSFEACRWQWGRGYIDKLSPRQEMPALKFGSMIHKALELRYPKGIKRGPKPAESFEKIFKKEQKSVEASWKMKVDEEWQDALALGIDMMEHYVEHYGKDEDWKVVASEMTFQVPVYLPEYSLPETAPFLVFQLFERGFLTLKQFEGKEPLFYYVGTMDGVWENRMDGGVRINDYKTCSGDPEKEAVAKHSLDEQGTAYWAWGAEWLELQKILKDRQIRDLDGMLYTFLRKGLRDTRAQNRDGLYLNLPKKEVLVQEILDRGGELPAKGEGSGKDGNVVVPDLMKLIGKDAAYLGEPSKDQPPPLFHREIVYRSEVERERTRERAIDQALNMFATRAGLLPIYKSPGTGYPSQQCRACSFRDMCELHESGDDWELMRDSTMGKWDPYDAHELAEEGKSK